MNAITLAKEQAEMRKRWTKRRKEEEQQAENRIAGVRLDLLMALRRQSKS